jgi:3'-phosphoadenosine 5'-phosphosulfate (PAPS) 3'-phosphatase
MIDYPEKLRIAKQAALEAGKYILKAMPEEHHIDKKGAVNLVTEVDRGSEKIIHEIITAAFPDDRFIAEEGSTNTGQRGWFGTSTPGWHNEFRSPPSPLLRLHRSGGIRRARCGVRLQSQLKRMFYGR